MRRRFTALALVGALALLAAGCGSGSSSSTSTASTASAGTTATQGTASTPTQAQPGATTTTPSSGGQGSSSTPSSSGDNSIQTYGSAAGGGEKAAISAAAFSFFRAMAASDYAKLCEGLSASNQKELQAFDKAKHKKVGCPAILKMLISTRGLPEARKAAAGTLTTVRVKGSTAFVIFKPKGGKPSYFVMKREGGAWKAISLAPGTPLNPLAGLGR